MFLGAPQIALAHALEKRAMTHRAAIGKVRQGIMKRAELSPRRPAEPETPAVSVVVVNYNAGRHLTRCLITLQQQTNGNEKLQRIIEIGTEPIAASAPFGHKAQ